MMTTLNDTERCAKCDSDLVITRGPGRVACVAAITLRVPETMELLRCHGCGAAYPTSAQMDELLEVVERDTIGYDKRGIPVLRGV